MLARRLPLLVVFVSGVLIVAAYFIPHAPFPLMQLWVLKWFIIISAFAMLIGVDSLILHNMRRVSSRGPNWPFALTLVVGFFLSLGWGLYEWYKTGVVNAGVIGRGDFLAIVNYGSPFDAASSYVLWFFQFVYIPLDSTMFSLLAFFIASAAYRAFRARTFEATLLLISAGIVMLGRVPYGGTFAVPLMAAFLFLIGTYQLTKLATAFGWRRYLKIALAATSVVVGVVLLVPSVYKPAADFIVPLSSWVMAVPQMAAKRGIEFGITMGGIAFSLRVITGIERGYLR